MLEIRAIVPDGLIIDATALTQAIQSTLDTEAQEVKAKFEQTVQSWNEKPTFTIEPNEYTRLVYTVNQVYGWVNDGTLPHEILPIRAQALRFMTGGHAKTMPGQLSSGAGSPGNNLVFTKSVMNPGITARDFDATIQEEEDTRFASRMQTAIDKAAA